MAQATFDPAELEEGAYKESLVASVAEMTSLMLEVVGARDTAAGLGLADARPLYRWRAGDGEPKARAVEDRLRALYRSVRMLGDGYGQATARVFLRSPHPELGDRAPLRVLAEDDDGVVEVLVAARAFLEG
jgi:hypothetical protein